MWKEMLTIFWVATNRAQQRYVRGLKWERRWRRYGCCSLHTTSGAGAQASLYNCCCWLLLVNTVVGKLRMGAFPRSGHPPSTRPHATLQYTLVQSPDSLFPWRNTNQICQLFTDKWYSVLLKRGFWEALFRLCVLYFN